MFTACVDVKRKRPGIQKYFNPIGSSSRPELPHFQLDTFNHPELKNCRSLADLTKGIVKTGKSSDYPMVERLLRLVITLPVSTATAERAFSSMKLVKTRLRTKLEGLSSGSCDSLHKEGNSRQV